MAQSLLARFLSDGDPARAPATAIIVAHPDDEVIGAGGRLAFLHQAVTVVHVTDGAPRNLLDARACGFSTREEYAAARREELGAALVLAGIDLDRTRTLDVVDQEASLDLVGLSFQLARLLGDIRPELVLTLPYEGGHPDHDATAFGVHAACSLLRREGRRPPQIVEMTSYHNQNGAMATCEFLASIGEVHAAALPDDARALKRAMLSCFSTQAKTLAPFGVDLERFRAAPDYAFADPPHAGPLYYEMFDWGMTGTRWCSLASQAMEELCVEGYL